MNTNTAPLDESLVESPSFDLSRQQVMETLGRPVHYVRWFSEIGLDEIPLVGGKNASLGEMYRELSPTGVRIPDGFAITAEAYRRFFSESNLDEEIRAQLQKISGSHIHWS